MNSRGHPRFEENAEFRSSAFTRSRTVEAPSARASPWLTKSPSSAIRITGDVTPSARSRRALRDRRHSERRQLVARPTSGAAQVRRSCRAHSIVCSVNAGTRERIDACLLDSRCGRPGRSTFDQGAQILAYDPLGLGTGAMPRPPAGDPKPCARRLPSGSAGIRRPCDPLRRSGKPKTFDADGLEDVDGALGGRLLADAPFSVNSQKSTTNVVGGMVFSPCRPPISAFASVASLLATAGQPPTLNSSMYTCSCPLCDRGVFCWWWSFSTKAGLDIAAAFASTSACVWRPRRSPGSARHDDSCRFFIWLAALSGVVSRRFGAH